MTFVLFVSFCPKPPTYNDKFAKALSISHEEKINHLENDEAIGENIIEDEESAETSAELYSEQPNESNSFFVKLSIISSIFVIIGAIYISIKLVLA